LPSTMKVTSETHQGAAAAEGMGEGMGGFWVGSWSAGGNLEVGTSPAFTSNLMGCPRVEIGVTTATGAVVVVGVGVVAPTSFCSFFLPSLRALSRFLFRKTMVETANGDGWMVEEVGSGGGKMESSRGRSGLGLG